MWTKICGFRDAPTAAAAANAGANAIGINFYPKSIRSVDAPTARELVDAIDGRSMTVGLFVDEPFDDLIEKVKLSGVDAIQLHGEEPPQFLVALALALPEHPIIKAFPVDHLGLHMVAQYLERCELLGKLPWACLLDTKVIGQRGGTGHIAPWDVIAAQYREEWPRLILAGGLKTQNVAEAIDQVEPWGVDVASGVERPRGVKDADLINELLALTAGL